MARQKESPQKTAMLEMMCGYLKNNNIRIENGTDIGQEPVKKAVRAVLIDNVTTSYIIQVRGGAQKSSLFPLSNHLPIVYQILSLHKT